MNHSFSLLGDGDLSAYRCLNENSTCPLLIVVDHGGRAIPKRLHNLGLDRETLDSHIAWDIGAAKVAEFLADHFNACTIQANYSRLVIDCNRYITDSASIVESSDGVVVPANRKLNHFEVERRIKEIYRPYHLAIEHRINRFLSSGQVPLILSVHSMTPRLGDACRQESIAICWGGDGRAAKRSLSQLNEWSDIIVGDNTPYAEVFGEDYTIPEHAISRGLPSLMVEFRQDLLREERGTNHWAKRFAEVVEDLLQQRYGFLHCPGPIR
ncbi:N-formylglutamate amidohydrolase [Pseudoteredinibacter isoporae]|uniref:Putative N-formylglutamate amidohydrolase n=1 Tax=Pseudoteredinibacter isoporae TaxID=570281 RepID=A0A7X0JSY6_9GAMM|nr:N-formylglutamate amidohydrolase [Pseudoteredinibacter isoporae]MBB6521123.1 putative N-formylglutamate amidohydrolase [Pseudoteredinibacter isoporae]NHO86684.1 hypothetical protein [Pseudoteredinibacter isoporae]NIB24864.1 hypothetical protein [Pseudoteredinibacter isoporae]